MADLLLSVLSLALIVVLACVALVLLGLAPYLRGIDMAERRDFSTLRWGAVSAAGPVLGLLLALWVDRGHHDGVLYVPALLLTWTVPAALSLLAPGQLVGGVQGAHER
jgi:multisubunit Na+/H+ antiporter MnhG subunit